MSRFENLEFESPEKSQQATPLLKGEAAFVQEATAAFESGRFEKALRLYAKVIEYNPRNTAAWSGQVRMLIELEEFEEARLWADKALAQFPDDPELLAAKAVALARLGDLDGALSYSDSAVESLANTPYIWLSRADVLMARNEKRAEHCFTKALNVAAGEWVVLWLASRIQAFYRCFAKGLKFAQQALSVDGGRAVLWAELARCQIGLGLPAAAQQAIAQARELDPELDVQGLSREARDTTFLDKVAARWRHLFKK